MDLAFDQVRSPIGTIVVVADGDTVCALDFEDCRPRMLALLERRCGPVRLRRVRDPGGFASRVRAYLAGDLDALADVPVDLRGTAFQQTVWAQLRTIRRGTTVSYAELAAAIGRPTAVRAVGATNGRNPVALAVPCHRVIGADGSLSGYAGGLERKRWLLRHEGVAI